MDPINIIVGLNLLATFGANMSGAKKGLKSTISPAKEKPNTYLQKLPLVLATLSLFLLILGVFKIGTLEYTEQNYSLRLTGAIIYIIFSWIQIWAYKTLGESYSQEILIFKTHKLITNGPFKFIRHPQYLSQIFIDLAGGIATFSFLLIPLALVEIPFVIMRAKLEEKLLQKNFKEQFSEYKTKSGFMIPFVG